MSLYALTVVLAALSLVVFGMEIVQGSHLTKATRLCFVGVFAIWVIAALAQYCALALGAGPFGIMAVKAARFLDFSLMPLAVVLIAFPIARRPYFKVALGIALFNVLVELVSIPFGVTFAVDESGVATQGPCYWIYAAICAAAFGFLAFELYRYGKTCDGCDKVSLVGIIALIAVGLGVPVVYPDLFVASFALCLALPALVIHYTGFSQQDTASALSEVSQTSRTRHLAMTALAKRYFSTHLIDFANESLTPISSNESVERIMAQCDSDMDKVPYFLETISIENYRDQISLFSDFSTLRQRLTERTSISLEFVSKDRGWCSVSFIVVDRMVTGEPSSVMFTLAVIDEEKRYQAELLSMSVIDPLTGLYNQRAYLEDVAAQSESDMSDDFVMISLDVNGLKAVNDEFGHAVGDQLLVGAGSCIRGAFARSGKCYRLGGDEFAVILNADADDFYNMIETFEALMGEWKHDLIGALSISSGYAFHGDYSELSVQELAHQADLRMYQAKRSYYENSNADRRLA